MVSELFVLSLSAVAFSPTGNVIAVFCIQLDLAVHVVEFPHLILTVK